MNLRAKAAGALAAHMLFWLLMLLALAGVLALAAALYLAIDGLIPRAGAAAATGGALLILVGVLAFGIYRCVRPPAPAPAATEQSAETKSLDDEIRPLIGDRAADWTRDNTGTAMIAALAAGVVVAASPRLRNTLFRAVEAPLRRQAARIISRYTGE